MRPTTYRNEVEALFNQECREKKNVAHSARARHTPGKGAKKAWSRTDKNGELSGPQVLYRMGRPLNWRAFTQTETSVLRDYLEMLRYRFGIGATNLPDMVGAKSAAVTTFLKGRGLSRVIPETPKEDWKADEWKAFCESLWARRWTPEDDKPIVGEVMARPEEKAEAIRKECAELIESVCKEHSITVKDLAARIGQPYSTVMSVKQGRVAAKRCQMYLDIIQKTDFEKKAQPAETPVVEQKQSVEEPQSEHAMEAAMVATDAALEGMEKMPTEEGIISLKGPAPVVLAALRAMLGESQEEVTLTLRKKTCKM